ncbi:MAG: aldo/keto reductase [Clostridia bacterium]|nr:aldo/keto reductase [Clostridia bacterium]
MRYEVLKGTKDTVSKIALGTDVYGTYLAESTAVSLLDEFCELGGTIIDTASVYGGEDDNISEKLIGKWMKEKKNRNKIFISTKGGHPRVNTMNISRLSKEEIEHDIDLSLKNLGIDCIDIYWLHRDDEGLPTEPIVDILDELVKKGKTRYIGLSNWTCQRINEANEYAKENNKIKIISSQIQYSIARAVVENNDPTLVLMNDKEYEYFKNHDLSVFAFASQAKGFFSKLDAGGIENLSDKARKRYLSDINLEIYGNLKKISDEIGETVGALTIASLVNNNNFQTIPIIGCKNLNQLHDSMRGTDIKLTQEQCNFITGR